MTRFVKAPIIVSGYGVLAKFLDVKRKGRTVIQPRFLGVCGCNAVGRCVDTTRRKAIRTIIFQNDRLSIAIHVGNLTIRKRCSFSSPPLGIKRAIRILVCHLCILSNSGACLGRGDTVASTSIFCVW